VSPISPIDILNVLLPILYAGTVLVYGRAFFSDVPWAKRIKTRFFLGTVTLHFVYLVLRTIEFRHPPVTSIFELLTVVAFSIAVAYLFIEFRTKAKGTGYFIANIAFLFQLVSSLFIRDLIEVPEVLRSNLFGLHISSAMLGYAAITISAVFGFLYLMLYHEIKSSRFGIVYQKLPNLETLERMGFTAFKMGFLLLGIAIVVGFVWLPSSGLDFSYLDPKLVGTVLIWLMYGIGILAKRRGGWKGRRVMMLSVWGFGITVVSMMVINLFLSGFHKFD